ncbi:polyadenylate-binding protein 4-like [Toxorhynchites rutilus septentrionalis]|uniref:polyadenylate-binding protein 4-like n=1 Tax=Toxorhynchites rutilus septentrionalis TaxID=329112 RepID=UPI00247A9A1C|nr:polyadenylate-binding protein 4-like [Toxorhynchites rutilus septentrionalis]
MSDLYTMYPGCSNQTVASLRVSNLHASTTREKLFQVFRCIGHIVSVRVCYDRYSNQPLGYAYVNFDRLLDAKRAIETLSRVHVNGLPMNIKMVGHINGAGQRLVNSTISIRNLDENIDKQTLHDNFKEFGKIFKCRVALDSNGKSKGFAFIDYRTEKAAKSAKEQMNGKVFNDRAITVSIISTEYSGRVHGVNLYVKNLGQTIDDKRLKELFEPFGEVISAKVKFDGNRSKGFGFVCFYDVEEGLNAVVDMFGRLVDGKHLYVGIAQPKKDRQAQILSNGSAQPVHQNRRGRNQA